MPRSRTPYGLEIIQSCLACSAHETSLFCNLGPEALGELNSMRQPSLYPGGAVLFVEGEHARGIFVLCAGRVKLTASSPLGRSVIIRIANAGEVLGLSGTVSDLSYVATAETLEPSQVNFIPRAEFMRFLERHGEAAVRVAQHLSMELRRAYHQVSDVVLSPNVRARLAALLLDYAERSGQPGPGGTRFQLLLTHQEIGELLGTSRETVSRILNEFRRQRLVQVTGAFVTILDMATLKALVG